MEKQTKYPSNVHIVISFDYGFKVVGDVWRKLDTPTRDLDFKYYEDGTKAYNNGSFYIKCDYCRDELSRGTPAYHHEKNFDLCLKCSDKVFKECKSIMSLHERTKTEIDFLKSDNIINSRVRCPAPNIPLSEALAFIFNTHHVNVKSIKHQYEFNEYLYDEHDLRKTCRDLAEQLEKRLPQQPILLYLKEKYSEYQLEKPIVKTSLEYVKKQICETFEIEKVALFKDDKEIKNIDEIQDYDKIICVCNWDK
jgi:hypothetical protein